MMNKSVNENLAKVHENIKAAARENSPPSLVAVSKSHPAETAREAIDAGQRIFGENRVQEALSKWPALKATTPDIELHLIGPLQTNKVKAALDLFDVIQTVDRLKLAKAIQKEITATGAKPRLFVQVNTGEEPQKAGVAPSELPGLLEECKDLGLKIEGLMCIPPADEEAAMHFALLKKLGDRHNLKSLSMGMSGDYEKAISLGATHVRVGTAIFGPRG